MTVAELITSLRALNAKADDIVEVPNDIDLDGEFLYGQVTLVYKPEDNVIRLDS